MILIRLKGVLTPAEERLRSDSTGRYHLKQARTRLMETSRSILEEAVESLTGVSTVSLHSDLSIRTGEQIILLALAEDLARFRQ